jgi:hypothetical protein
MYHLKMERQMNNAKSVRTPTLPELFDDNKSLMLLPQVQVSNHSTPDMSMTTPGNKHLRHRLPLSSDATTINIAPTDYVPETSSGTLSVMVLKFTTLLKPTWSRSVTTPSEIIPYYRLNHSIWSISDNKESSR